MHGNCTRSGTPHATLLLVHRIQRLRSGHSLARCRDRPPLHRAGRCGCFLVNRTGRRSRLPLARRGLGRRLGWLPQRVELRGEGLRGGQARPLLLQRGLEPPQLRPARLGRRGGLLVLQPGGVERALRGPEPLGPLLHHLLGGGQAFPRRRHGLGLLGDLGLGAQYALRVLCDVLLEELLAVLKRLLREGAPLREFPPEGDVERGRQGGAHARIPERRHGRVGHLLLLRPVLALQGAGLHNLPQLAVDVLEVDLPREQLRVGSLLALPLTLLGRELRPLGGGPLRRLAQLGGLPGDAALELGDAGRQRLQRAHVRALLGLGVRDLRLDGRDGRRVLLLHAADDLLERGDHGALVRVALVRTDTEAVRQDSLQHGKARLGDIMCLAQQVHNRRVFVIGLVDGGVGGCGHRRDNALLGNFGDWRGRGVCVLSHCGRSKKRQLFK
mmetsp:Transcript_116062/g.328936  ORF Transcript_116062/g.328936 Transcript_116062/m.328936 type:complete len:442 (+) Transcript_116062:55-1380(+)